MSLFISTFLVTIICCLLMGLGLLLSGKPLQGGCGKTPPGAPRCAGCPNRGRHETPECSGRGDS